ncbi:hypothetical protein GA830_08795 [Mesorhizobium sp. NBSH29]|uniref:hypothetical protein n=1 Tax=Mesorhizobium sp. NBSH29 TaxID=2654249 RepID=UPI0018966263|nr:hypothetical protein [Mesorhizobium sp. NBSH29]QPC86824.1 hypothetical protein GA830_08795 [Mesorhizobium sp. NBSH29]
MPLQNRVDPFGVVHAVAERGLFTGNRGIIHDPDTRTLLKKRWASPAWIICVCDFRDVRRVPMGRNGRGGEAGWTELFFLDEVTALAAGHRPCFHCQRLRAKTFGKGFAKAFPHVAARTSQIDRQLHKERLAVRAIGRALEAGETDTLPDGTMVAGGSTAFALKGGWLLPWSFTGYGPSMSTHERALTLITPPTTVAILAAGFSPVWHPSAGP